MSSRALRKAQKERERQELDATAGISEDGASDDEAQAPRGKASAFAMLAESGMGDEEDEEDEDDADKLTSAANTQTPSEKYVDACTAKWHTPKSTELTLMRQSSTGPDIAEDKEPDPQNLEHTNVKTAPSRKKKKKKRGQKIEALTPEADKDDIDAALKSLSVSAARDSATAEQPVPPMVSGLCKVLSIDTHHLHIGNEMKRLFGKAALDVDRHEGAHRGGNRRADGQGDGIGLAEAVAGKNSQGGAGLPDMIRRRNVFVQGKEEWPKASGGGLGMEIIKRDNNSGVVEYAFVHNTLYQSSQREFDTCVLSMDPNLMVNLLRFNPYHISSLLQVSDIAKHERDHTTSGDLLERALFSFGRAVHPTFAKKIAEGKARLNFHRPENREFFLAAYRYILNIGMRATWRTAYEWAKLVLSLDDDDPFEMKLVIDQLAIRARQYQSLLDIANCQYLEKWWIWWPNICFSKALAIKALSTDGGEEAKQALIKTIESYPWVAANLLQVLDVAKIPPAVWGSSPFRELPAGHLHSEIYITQGLDLWKTTEAKEFLIKLTEDIGSSSDPLPPKHNLPSYDTGVRTPNQIRHADPRAMIQDRPHVFIHEIAELHRIFELLIPGFTERMEHRENPETPLTLTEADISRALEHSRIPAEELAHLLERLVRFRQALMEQPEQTVTSPHNGEAVMTENGTVRIRRGRQNMEDHDAQQEMQDERWGGPELRGLDR